MSVNSIVQKFSAGRATNPNQSELLKWRLYDWQLYAQAGQTQLTFFSNPIGQGVTTALGATVGSAKTIQDTNLSLANTLPNGQQFLIESLEVHFWPGSSAAANTFLAALNADFSAVAADAAVAAVNDIATFSQSGILTLRVLDKNYVQDGPMANFPPKKYLDGQVGIASNAAATGAIMMHTVHSGGVPYYLDQVEITLQPAVNFGVTLQWPGVVALPSGFNARVGVILDGYLMRASQ